MTFAVLLVGHQVASLAAELRRRPVVKPQSDPVLLPKLTNIGDALDWFKKVKSRELIELREAGKR